MGAERLVGDPAARRERRQQAVEAEALAHPGRGAAFDQAKAQLEATSGKGGSGGGSGYPGSSLGGQIANGAKLAAMTARNVGEAYASDVGRRLSGAPGASAGFLGARMARHSGGAAASTRGDTAARNAARAAEPAYDP